MKSLSEIGDYDVVENAIPYHFFRTSGRGQSEITYHAGSYHLALADAGIEKCNITKYSSILPVFAEEVEMPKDFYHGQSLATISAEAGTHNGERVTAGLGEAWLISKKDGLKAGGIVAEHSGYGDKSEAEEQLRKSLDEIYNHKFYKENEVDSIKITIESFQPTKKYGTAMVVLGFTDFIIPIKKRERRTV